MFYKRRERDFAKGLAILSLPTPSPSLPAPASPTRDSVSSSAAPPESNYTTGMFTFPGLLLSPSSSERTTNDLHDVERDTEGQTSTVVSQSPSPTKSMEIRGTANHQRSARESNIVSPAGILSGNSASLYTTGDKVLDGTSTSVVPSSEGDARQPYGANDKYISRPSSGTSSTSRAVIAATIPTESDRRESRSDEKYVASEVERDGRRSYAHSRSSLKDEDDQRFSQHELPRSESGRESSRSQSRRSSESKVEMDPFKMAYGAINPDRKESSRKIEEPQRVESRSARETEIRQDEARSRRLESRSGREMGEREDYEERSRRLESRSGREAGEREDYEERSRGLDSRSGRGRQEKEDDRGSGRWEKRNLDTDHSHARSLHGSSRSRSPRRKAEDSTALSTRPDYDLFDWVPIAVQELFSEVYLKGLRDIISPHELEGMLRSCCPTPPIGCKFRGANLNYYCFIAFASEADAKRVLDRKVFRYRDQTISAMPCRASSRREPRKLFLCAYI